MRHKKKLIALLMSSAVIAACGSEEIESDSTKNKAPLTEQAEQIPDKDKETSSVEDTTKAEDNVSEETKQKENDKDETKSVASDATMASQQKGETTPMKKEGSLTVEQVEKQREEREKEVAANQEAVSEKDTVVAKEAKEVASLKITKGVMKENLVSFLVDDVKAEAPFYITVNETNYFFRQSQANAKRYVTEIPADVTEETIQAASLKSLAK